MNVRFLEHARGLRRCQYGPDMGLWITITDIFIHVIAAIEDDFSDADLDDLDAACEARTSVQGSVSRDTRAA